MPHMEEILAELERLGWGRMAAIYFGIQMALDESLTNAIRHGNRLDESKQVLVECKASARAILAARDGRRPRLSTEGRARLHGRRESGVPRRPRPGTDQGLHDARRVQRLRQLRHDGKNPHRIVASPPPCRPCEPGQLAVRI